MRPRLLCAVAFLACATLARAESLRLVAPAAGATLRGASAAELRWSASELPKGAEEWEAFLSIDGGRYYAFRVTPHLDLDLRRFTFIVPNVDARDARFLLRVGNERREVEFEIPGSFAIERDPDAEIAFPRLAQPGRAEAARAGDPDVLAWADGARDGSGVTQHAMPAKPAAGLTRVTKVAAEDAAEVAPALAGTAPSAARTQPAARPRATRAAERLPLSLDLLLVCRRRNI